MHNSIINSSRHKLHILTYRGDEAEVRGRVEAEAGDGVTAEERGPAGQHLAPQQGSASVGLGAGAQPGLSAGLRIKTPFR